jgi:azurin
MRSFFPVLFCAAASVFLPIRLGAQPAPPAADARATPVPIPLPRAVSVTMRDGLRFSPPRFSASPGEEISLEINNGDTTDLSHNFVLLKPGTREVVLQQALALGERGPQLGFVPESDAVLWNSPLLPVDGVSKVVFRIPDQPGIYPYVCTFPGHGMVMYGAIYVGVPMPELEKDTNIPPSSSQSLIAGGGRRPFIQRIFMPNSGPAAIAVALHGSQNVCWDAGECRLRYAWQGTFIDASENWRGNGNILAKLPSAAWWSAPRGEFPLRFGGRDSSVPTVRFLGYRPMPDGVEFHYRADGLEVFERVLSAREQPGISLHFRILGATLPVFFRGPVGPDSRWLTSKGTVIADTLELTPVQAANFAVTLASALCKP